MTSNLKDLLSYLSDVVTREQFQLSHLMAQDTALCAEINRHRDSARRRTSNNSIDAALELNHQRVQVWTTQEITRLNMTRAELLVQIEGQKESLKKATGQHITLQKKMELAAHKERQKARRKFIP